MPTLALHVIRPWWIHDACLAVLIRTLINIESLLWTPHFRITHREELVANYSAFFFTVYNCVSHTSSSFLVFWKYLLHQFQPSIIEMIPYVNLFDRAYRLEPLILKHYSDVVPTQIHRSDQARQVELTYGELPTTTYSQNGVSIAMENLREKNNNGSDSETSPNSPRMSRAASSSSFSNKVSSVWARWSKKPPGDMEVSAELADMEKTAHELELKMNQHQKQLEEQYAPADKTDLEHRLDYQLRESKLENTYLAVLTAHTSYWANPDIGLFILTQLHPEYRANSGS